MWRLKDRLISEQRVDHRKMLMARCTGLKEKESIIAGGDCQEGEEKVPKKDGGPVFVHNTTSQ
jgi:hypothetical protein